MIQPGIELYTKCMNRSSVNLLEVALTFEFEVPGSQSNEGNSLQKV